MPSEITTLIKREGYAPVLENARLLLAAFNDEDRSDTEIAEFAELINRKKTDAIPDIASEMIAITSLFTAEMDGMRDALNNKEHRRKINNEALDDMIAAGYTHDEAVKFLTLIAKK